MTSIPFFLNTWEEYYTGELNFPIVHGVSEGTLVACIVMNLSGFLGTDIWLNKVNILGYSLQINKFALTINFICGVGYGLISLVNVMKNYKHKTDTLHNLFIFILMIITLCIVLFFTESQIINNYPKLIIILYGFIFAKLVGHLQLAHLADAHFMQFRKTFLTSFILLDTVTLANYFLKIQIVDIDKLIIVLLVLHFIGNSF
jgi:ethanolaminephosphotransferase